MDFEIKIADYLGMQVEDVAKDLRIQSKGDLIVLRHTLINDILDEKLSEDKWLLKLIEKELSVR